MNVLFLTDGITPFIKGGMQRHSQLVIENLAKRGHSITAYHYIEAGTKINHVDAFSIEALKNIRLVQFEYRDNNKFPGHYIRAQRQMSERYLEELKSENVDFDFIYAKGFMSWALLKSRSRLGINTPVGVKFHGMNMFQKQPDLKSFFSNYILRPTTKEILKKADYVFSYGGKITDIIASQCSTPIIEVPTGIESEWLTEIPTKNNAKRRFLFIGRFDRVKGLPELYKALVLLKAKRSDWEFHFIGPIPTGDQIEMEQTTYHGAIYNQNHLKELISENDILVNCSISEGMPNVILEAMASGLAVIATDIGASSVLVNHEKNGLLLKIAEPKLIVRSLLDSLQISDSELKNWKVESLIRVQSMTWDSVAPKLEEAIHRCIKG